MNRANHACTLCLCLCLFSAVQIALGREGHEVMLSVRSKPGAVFISGEPVLLTIELTNGSEKAILEPWYTDWEFALEACDGQQFRDNAPPGQARFWVVPPQGQKVTLPRIEPGKHIKVEPSLQCRFAPITEGKEGEYTVVLSVKSAYLPSEKEVDPATMNGKGFVVRSEPFRFSIDNRGVIWKRKVGDILFRIADVTNALVVSVCRVQIGSKGQVHYSDFRALGEVAQSDIVPQLKEYGQGGVALRFSSPGGKKRIFFVDAASHEIRVAETNMTDGVDWPTENTVTP